MTDSSPAVDAADAARLETRVRELEHERKHLLAIIEILEDIAGSLNFVDIVQSIARKLGEAFGLDRCSIFLAERGGRTARLVASYENPSIRNYIVDLERYPELKRALQSGETVFIPDAQADPNLKHIKASLASRRVRSITVVPITWRGVAIGAIFLRSFVDGPTFSDADVRFTQVIGSLTAKALRNAYRYERVQGRHREAGDAHRPDLERQVLIAFCRRLLDTYARRDPALSEHLPQSSSDELDRLVEIAMAVVAEEGKGS